MDRESGVVPVPQHLIEPVKPEGLSTLASRLSSLRWQISVFPDENHECGRKGGPDSGSTDEDQQHILAEAAPAKVTCSTAGGPLASSARQRPIDSLDREFGVVHGVAPSAGDRPSLPCRAFRRFSAARNRAPHGSSLRLFPYRPLTHRRCCTFASNEVCLWAALVFPCPLPGPGRSARSTNASVR